VSGEMAVKENARGAGDLHSLQRCPNGSGGQRKTSSFVANVPSAGNPGNCLTDDAPVVSSINPEDGATGVPQNSSFMVTFSEPVALDTNAIRLTCSRGDNRAVITSGGPVIFTVSPVELLPPVEICRVVVVAAGVQDKDQDDPPNNMV